MKKTGYEKILNDEINKRIAMMENKEYKFPRRFSKSDYICTISIALICLFFIILGAFL